MNKFAFNPERLDISKLRTLPEVAIARMTAIPAVVLGRGKFSSQELAELAERQRESKQRHS